GHLARMEGALLVGCGILHMTTMIRVHGRGAAAADAAAADGPGGLRPLDVLVLVVGIVVTLAGADLLVDGAVSIAQALGVTDAIIGLTIVAMGTCAPELATTLVATLRGGRDVAVGNLIGSCVYNI